MKIKLKNGNLKIKSIKKVLSHFPLSLVICCRNKDDSIIRANLSKRRQDKRT